MSILTWTVLILAAVPGALFAVNLFLYRPAPRRFTGGALPSVSLLIPARNEEESIGELLDSVRGSVGVDYEVVVLDDGSTDRTAEFVEARASRDPRIRLVRSRPLPDGWCGKQYACWQLAGEATGELLVFVDADVRLDSRSLARVAAFQRRSGTALVSGIPREVTSTAGEALLIPLIHTILLGYLPVLFMRWSKAPAFAAGCGQLMAVTRSGYAASGGHRAIRGTLHDGVMLPRLFRRAGLKTDLFDATDLASCRMYDGWSETWAGLGKNATEGLGAPASIVPWTLVLLGGQVLPFVLAPWTVVAAPSLVPVAVAAVVAAWLPRWVAMARFGQKPFGALLHPLGVCCLVAIQWVALGRMLAGRPSAWKGRSYGAAR